MKKITCLLLTLVMILGLFSGCAQENVGDSNAGNSANTGGNTDSSSGGEVLGDKTIEPPSGYTPDPVVPKRAYKIAMSGANQTDANTTLVVEQMKLAAEYYGVELLTAYNNSDPIQVNTNVENAITWGAEYYINYNEDTEANKAAGARLKEEGIPGLAIQVTMGEDFPFYRMDNAKAGNLAGTALAEQGKAKFGDEEPILIVLDYPEGGELFQLRTSEMIKAVEEIYPNIDVVQFSSEADAEVARQKTADALTANPDRKILYYGHHDQFTLAGLSAIEAAGRTADTVCTSIVGLEMMFPEIMKDDSPVYGTVSIMTVQWAWDVMAIAIKQLNGEEIPSMEIDTPCVLLTKETLPLYFPEWCEENGY